MFKVYLLVACILPILLLVSAPETKAQFHQYTYVDDFGSINLGSINITNDGILWAADFSGNLISYDGKGIKNYPTSALNFSPFRQEAIEHNGYLWLMSGESPAMYFKDEKWNRPSSEAEVCRLISINNELIGINYRFELYKFDYQKEKWIYQSKLAIDANKYKNSKIRFLKLANNEFIIRIFTNQKYQHNDYYRIKNLQKGIVDKLLFDAGHIIWFRSLGHYILKKDNRITVVKNGVESALLYDDGTIVKDPKILRDFNDPIILDLVPLSEESEQQVLNIIKIDEKGDLKILAKILYAYMPLGISFDQNGNIWLASQTGIIKVVPSVLNFFDWHPNMITTFITVNEDGDGNIWFGGNRDGFCYFDGERLHSSPKNLKDLNQLLPGSYRNDKGEMFHFDERFGFIKVTMSGWETISPLNINAKMIGYTMMQIAKDKLALGLRDNGIGVLNLPIQTNDKWDFIQKKEGLLFAKIFDITVDKKGRIWSTHLGEGISVYDPKKDTTKIWSDGVGEENKLGGFSLLSDTRGNLWMGTPTGIAVLPNAQEVLLTSEEIEPYVRRIKILEAGDSKVLSVDTFRNYLVFTNEDGHGFLDLDEYYKTGSIKTFYYNTSDDKRGGSGTQNTIYKDTNGKLWIGKERGVVRLDMDKFRFDTGFSQFVIDTVTSGSENLESLKKEGITLSYGDRAFYFKLKQEINKITDEAYLFNYSLSEVGDKTPLVSRKNTSGEFIMEYLNPGNYELKVDIYKNNIIIESFSVPIFFPFKWSEDPLIYNFTVISIALLIISYIYILYRVKISENRAKLELSKLRAKVDQMQIKAISSALNPHFINNSLHWMQSKVRNQPDLVKVIGKMSENIRMLFKQSRLGVPYHSLKEEVILVDNYLQIQHARYGERLKSSIPNYKELGGISELRIPIMQIQIHVENAIEHGIRNRMQANTLKVTIEEENDFVTIDIIDDGIGRRRAKEMNSKGTQQGVIMLEEIHKIYNSKNKHKIRYWYEDLPFHDKETGESFGTIVTIKIPKEYNYEIE